MLKYRSSETGIKTIAVCAAQVPFFSGGAELHVNALIKQLRLRDYQVELINLPYKWYPQEQLFKSIEMWQKVDLTESNGLPIDLVIATKFPSYFIQHPNKVLWLIHQYRQIYDLAGTPYSEFDMSRFSDRRLRKKIAALDSKAMRGFTRRFSNAQNTADRLLKYNQVDAKPLYHPPSLEGQYRCDAYDGSVLSVGRLDSLKRIDVLIEAIAQAKQNIECVIAGTGPEREHLENLAETLGVKDRVTFLGYVSNDELIDLYARCSAVYFAPKDEDYGYITLEAFLSHKPVITASDSGGPLEFVKHNSNGIVLQCLDVAELSRSVEQLCTNQEQCRELGTRGFSSISHIHWNDAIGSLLGVTT